MNLKVPVDLGPNAMNSAAASRIAESRFDGALGNYGVMQTGSLPGRSAIVRFASMPAWEHPSPVDLCPEDSFYA